MPGVEAGVEITILMLLILSTAEILDESGVTPAHFAAQGGHLDCLQVS